MNRAPFVILVLAAGAGCRAAPLPPERWYPAGTGLTPRYVTVDGTRLRYVDTGSGPAVVLVHGLGGSIYSWRFAIEPIARAGYRVIAFDNRGFGGSAKPDTGYSNDDYTRLLVDLLDSLHVADAVLVGHSMGGEIAAAAALAAPARVRGLVLIDASGYGPSLPWYLRYVRWPVIGRLALDFRGRGITARILRSTFGDPSRVTADEIDQYYAPVPDPAFAHALYMLLRRFDFDALRGRLGAVAAPTLVIWGGRDRIVPVSDGLAMMQDLPRAVFVLVPQGGHNVQEERPDAVDRAVIAFLREGLPSPPPDVTLRGPGPRAGKAQRASRPLIPRRAAAGASPQDELD